MDRHSSPNFGQRLITTLIDETAAKTPNKIYLSQCRSSDPKDGFQDITYSEFARAVDRCAHWLESLLGRSETFRALLAMLAPHDLRHALLVLAANKTGHCMFFSSPGNTLLSHVALLERLDCAVLFKPDPYSPVLDDILSKRPMRVISLPVTDFFFATDQATLPYPYLKTYAEAQDDPLAILHSSGTTGVPKVLAGKHGTYSAMDAYQLLEHEEGPVVISCWKQRRVLMTTPFFHSSGLPLILAYSAFFDYIPVLIPSAPTITTAITHSAILTANVQCVFTMPNILLDFARNPTYLDHLRRLDSISWAGCALPPPVAQTLSTTLRCIPMFGSTESMFMPGLIPPPNLPGNGNYHRFSPSLGAFFHPHPGQVSHSPLQEQHELVIRRDPALKPFQAVFYTLPEAARAGEYATKDLYVRHPDPQWRDWWRSVGRTDDVLVLLDAKKVNPVLMEGTIGAHPSVAGAVIAGHMRGHVCLLLEPVGMRACGTRAEERAFVEAVWPAVCEAMESAPAGGRLEKEWVIVTPCGPEEGLKRAGGKSTIQRQGTVERFAAAIEEVYD